MVAADPFTTLPETKNNLAAIAAHCSSLYQTDAVLTPEQYAQYRTEATGYAANALASVAHQVGTAVEVMLTAFETQEKKISTALVQADTIRDTIDMMQLALIRARVEFNAPFRTNQPTPAVQLNAPTVPKIELAPPVNANPPVNTLLRSESPGPTHSGLDPITERSAISTLPRSTGTHISSRVSVNADQTTKQSSIASEPSSIAQNTIVNHVDQVRALYPFSGIEENEMVGIEAGDILNVIDKDIGEGWMRVEGPISRPQKEQMDGLIPQSYVEML